LFALILHNPVNPVSEPPPIDANLLREIFAAQGISFRGGAVENLEGAPMGKGHGNAGQPFDIETACYLKPKFAEYDKARRNGTRLKLVDKSGVKTIKSFALEVCAGEHVSNASGDAAIFFGSESAAEATATTRILDFFRVIPRFAKKLESIRSRFDETMGAVKFPDKTLFILSANMGNTQQKNLAFVGLQDAFVTEASGMIDEMIARTTQYEKECIIYLESQGGEKGFDFDRHYDDTDQRELHVNCPCCGSQHIFNWKAFDEASMTRPEDFRAVLPKQQSEKLVAEAHGRGASPEEISESLRLCGQELSEKLKGKVAGFRRGDDELIKLPNGDYNEAAILRETHFECYHCGGIWRDDGEFGPTRIALDKSSHYVAARTDALPGNVGFNTPQWINRRLGWGKMMLEKLKCQKLASELGNYEPLKKWWQKTAARTWDTDINTKAPERASASLYDAKEKIPGELARVSATDIQFKLTHMVYLAVALGDGVPPRVLHYEWVKPPSGLTDHAAREFCKARVRALDKEFGIEQQNSMKDGAHEPGLVREWAAEDAVFAKFRVGGRIKPAWAAYGLLIGDDRASYKWTHPGRKDTWERFKQYHWHKEVVVRNGKREMVDVHHRLWSNPSIKEIAERWRDGEGAPKLQIHADWLKDTSKEGLWAQLTSERKIPWKGHPGKLHYNNEGRPNHAWDCWCMIVVRMDEMGLLNTFGPPSADDET
jgi:hypothetical protein